MNSSSFISWLDVVRTVKHLMTAVACKKKQDFFKVFSHDRSMGTINP